MLRQRNPSRLRPENLQSDPQQDRAWSELLRRRRLHKDNLNRIKNEIEEATLVLMKMNNEKRLNDRIITDHDDFKSKGHNFRKRTFDWESPPRIVTENPNYECKNLKNECDIFRQRSVIGDAKKNFSANLSGQGVNFSAKSLPSRWKGFVENCERQKIDSTSRGEQKMAHPQSATEARPTKPTPAKIQSELTAQDFNQIGQFKNEHRRIKFKHHTYDRIPIFTEDIALFFRKGIEDLPQKAEANFVGPRLIVSVTLEQQYLQSHQSLTHNCLSTNSQTAERSSGVDPKSEIASVSIEQTFLWTEAKNFQPSDEVISGAKCSFHSSSEEKMVVGSSEPKVFVNFDDPQSKPSEYRLHLGKLTTENIKEFEEINSKALDMTADISRGFKSPTKSKFSNSAMIMWNTLSQVDSDSGSEYEYEDENPSSPYYRDPTLDIDPKPECLRPLSEWVKSFFDHDEESLMKLNRTFSPTNNFVLKQETIRNTKTREVLYLMDVSYRGDVRDGFYRELDADGLEIKCIGRHLEDEKVGVSWKRLDGNGFIVGPTDNNNNDYHAVYLYPDLTCAITGKFKNGKLVAGNFGKVFQVQFDEWGIPMPVVTILDKTRSFTYDPSMSVRISKSPLVRDPYEHESVYVAQSKIAFAGEGLFAKKAFHPGTLLALFNGIRQREVGFAKNVGEFSDYRIGLGAGDVCLDIPNQCVSLGKYCATTGHKACHSFTPNAAFKEFQHPRFGRIMSIVAETIIQPHEEILVSYNYRIHQAPVWYKDLYFQHLREDKCLSEEVIYQIARRMGKQHGAHIEVPPPVSRSPRFLPCGVCSDHVGYDVNSVACLTCQKWFHVRCTDLNVDDVCEVNKAGRKIVKEDSEWRCKFCANEHLV